MIRAGIQRIGRCYNGFLFESCSPITCVLLRVTYATLLIVYSLVWLQDATKWFSDAGVMSIDTAQAILDGPQLSIFYFIPATPTLVWMCMGILLLNAVFLLIGFHSRIQAAFIFFWLVNFQHRNPLILDGEDTVFRLFAFFFIFLPLDYAWSVRNWKTGIGDSSPTASPSLCKTDWVAASWGLRLIQVEMALIYISAAWSKALGTTWQDGSALYYVFQMGDLFGRGPLPAFVTETEFVIRYSTWAVVVVEGLLPFALFWRPTRKLAIIVGIGLHLTMEYAMHLHLFQWIMIVGLLSFIHPREWITRRKPTPSPSDASDASPTGAIPISV